MSDSISAVASQQFNECPVVLKYGRALIEDVTSHPNRDDE
jgi:hypothetical protein